MDNEEGVLTLQIIKDQIAELRKWSAYHDDAILINIVDLEVGISLIEERMLGQIEHELMEYKAELWAEGEKDDQALKEQFQSVPYEGGDK